MITMSTKPTLEELTAAKLAGLTEGCEWCNGYGKLQTLIEDKTETGWKKGPEVPCGYCGGRGWIIHRPVEGGVRR